MPRLYREAPLNSIWEGSGNVMGLDVLRAMGREAEAIPAVMAELDRARGDHPNLDRAIDDLGEELTDREGLEGGMRMVTELMALSKQAGIRTESRGEHDRREGRGEHGERREGRGVRSVAKRSPLVLSPRGGRHRALNRQARRIAAELQAGRRQAASSGVCHGQAAANWV